MSVFDLKECLLFNLYTKMNRNKYLAKCWTFLIILTGCLLYTHIALTQAKPGSLSNGFIPEVVPPSPTAASLGKFGAWPVSYYTGVPEISIPIYEIKSRKLSLPVSLSYHGSGIKIEEMSGWTGVGWALNAGGVITRTIVGLPDNDANGFYTRMREGKFFNSSYSLTDLESYFFLNKVAEGDIDTQPDVYFFNFNGRSGKFFFDERGLFHSIPENALKLTKNPLTSSSADNIWEIVDENGVTYTFGSVDGISGGIEQSEVINSDMPGATNFYDNAWYLTRIVSNDKTDTISLRYSSKTEYYTMKSVQSIKELSERISGYPASSTWSELLHLSQVCYNGSPDNDLANTRFRTNGTGTLASIKWSQGEMIFSAGSARQDLMQGKLLDSMQVISKESGDIVEKFVLQYSYKGDRYYLDSISEYNRSRSEKLLHSFYYYPGLPSRFSNSQDHWGYFNAAANNNLLPNDPSFQRPTSANREPNEAAAKCGTLKRIKYPTGGYTDFDYELHRYIAGSIPNAPTTEIGTGTASVATYNFRRPIPHDSVVLFDVPFAQSAATISISYENYHRPNAKVEGWLPYVRLERLNGDNYIIVQEWNAFDQFPGGNIPVNTDGTYNFTVPSATLSLVAGSYRLTADNSCSGFRCPDDNTTKAAIYADVTYRRYVQVPGPTQPDPVAGGLRIKTITNFDNIHNTPAEIKTFRYSAGNILSYPRYLHFYAENVYGYEDKAGKGPCNTDFAKYRELTSTSQAILGLTQGSSVGYTSVKEYNVDANGADNGYSEFKFLFAPDSANSYYFDHSYWPYVDVQTANASIPVNDYSYKRGLLSEKIVYVKSESTYKPINSLKETYAFNDGDTTQLYKRMKAMRVQKLRQIIYPCFDEDANGNHIPREEHFEYDYGYGFYNVVTSWVQKKSTEEKVYDMTDGSAMTTVTEYFYDNNKHLATTRIKVTDSKGDVYTTYNKYPHEMVSGGNVVPYSDMISRNMIGNVIEQKTIKNDAAEQTLTRINYSSFTSNLIAPSKLEVSLMGNPLEESATLQQYDAAGNVVQYKERKAPVLSLIYDHNNSIVVAKVTNATVNNVAYTGFESSGNGGWQLSGNKTNGTAFTGKSFYSLNSGNINKSGLDASLSYIVTYWSNGASASVNGQTGVNSRSVNGWTLYKHQVSGASGITVSGTAGIDELRLHPVNAQMITYSYNPLIGLVAQGDVNNQIVFYEYDGFNRLLMIRDIHKNILKKYEYSYVRPLAEANATVFFNVEKRQNFTSNNCPDGIVSIIPYIVPAEKYTSYVSQEDADNKALADISANGQAYANTYGLCSYKNTAISRSFTRNNCTAGGVPSSVIYNVEEGKYRSTTSQAEADELALADLNNNGQNYANQNATCTFYNVQRTQIIARNNCADGGVPSSITYNIAAGKYSSGISQDDADSKAWAEILTDGQNYANTNATCTYKNDAMSASFTRSCSNGARGSAVIYNVEEGKHQSDISKADANAKAQADINANGQNYANTNGTCRFYNVAMSQVFTKNNCGLGYNGTQVSYNVSADTYYSEISQTDANAKAQADINTNGQSWANSNASCTVDNSANVFVGERTNAGVGAFMLTISTINGAVIFQQTFKEIGDPALPFKVSIASGSYVVKLEGMQQFKASVNGSEQTVTTSKTWNVSNRVIIEVYK